MTSKAEKRAAEALVATYYEARLADLLEHVGEAFARYRASELDPFAMDEILHRYSKAARSLWKFCWSGGSGTAVHIVAGTLQAMGDEGRTIDWWEEAGRRGRT